MTSTAQTDSAHLLIVDDDERLRTLLRTFLTRNGYLVSLARDAGHARRLLEGLEFDLIVLDVMMPGEDGLSLTHDLKSQISTPILLLTAQGETENKIDGLEAGADDYMTKPFEPRELVLRISAILRRIPKPEPKTIPPKTLQLGSIRYDVTRGEMWHGSEMIRLTSTESALMRILSATPHEPVSRISLVEALGREESHAQERAIDVQVTRLRRKIEENPKTPRYLQTVRGAGYMLAPD